MKGSEPLNNIIIEIIIARQIKFVTVFFKMQSVFIRDVTLLPVLHGSVSVSEDASSSGTHKTDAA
jgi:hypothetical protein